MIGRMWAMLMTRGPTRGTTAHFFGSIGLAIILGLAFWWARAHT